MKRYRILSVLMAVLALTSCLNEHPKDQLDEDAIYGSASEIYTNAVASLYNYIGGANESEGIQGTCRGIYDYNTLTTDEAIIPIRGGDWYDGGLWNAMYQHRWTEDDASLYDTWKYLYKVIVLANKSLDIIDAKSSMLTASQKDKFKAEVRAIRALMYYEAMDMFGRIPVVLSSGESEIYQTASKMPDISLADTNLSAQSERSETFRFIFSELQQVLPYLSEEHSNKEGNYYGRMTQPVVNFLLAKLALNAEIYMFDDWTEGYAKRPKGKDIYFMVQTADGAYSLKGGKASEHRSMKLNAWETCIYYCDKLASEGYDLEEDDAFNFSTHNETSKENIFTIPAQNLTNSKYIKTAGARMAKYEVDRTSYMDGKLQSNDIVLFRYADVLLMKAEAKVRNGGEGNVELNRIRSRVGMPNRQATLDNILEERLLELVWEGWRRQDLIRFGKFTAAYDLRIPLAGESSGYTTVFPIPKKCMELNKKLVQNKGYEKSL